MPDDYPLSSANEPAHRELEASYRRTLRSMGMERENPLYPGIRDFGPKREEQEREEIRKAIEIGSRRELIEITIDHIVRDGNRKLPDNYLIFNMTTAHRCPSLRFHSNGRIDRVRTTCQAFADDGRFDCYAVRDEQNPHYKSTWPFRVRQMALWNLLLKKNPDIMVDAVRTIWMRSQRKRPVAIRFSEAGDFPDQASVNAFMDIGDSLRDLDTPKGWGLPFITYVYTARRELDFSAAAGDDQITVMGSNFKARGVKGTFLYVNHPGEGHPETGTGDRWGRFPTVQWAHCFMNCRGCRRCLLGLNTKVPRHGGAGIRHTTWVAGRARP